MQRMRLKKIIRNLLIGKDEFIASRTEYKSAMLRAQMAVTTTLVCLVYVGIDWVNGITIFNYFYLLGVTVSFISIILNRKGHYQVTSVLLLVIANFLAYIFASNDTYRAGTYIYLIVCCLLALALFGYRYRPASLFFCLISATLFVMSYVYEIKIFILSPAQQLQVYGEQYVRITFIINFFIATALCVLIFSFLLSANHHSEKEILLKNELLLKTNEELDRFVYSASHDLKAPLSSMLGLIEIAQRTDDPEEVKLCLGMMKTRINNLDDFILEIIDYSRNSRLELKKESFKLVDLVKEVVDSLRYADGFENIYFKLDVPVDLEINSDRGRLKVILNNLVGNSLKYNDAGKDEKLVEIKTSHQNDWVVIQVNDNGIGIAEEHQPKIFDMFYRATERSKGSGLGLYIAKETIEKLGGKISLTSEVGQGTNFSVAIPALVN